MAQNPMEKRSFIVMLISTYVYLILANVQVIIKRDGSIRLDLAVKKSDKNKVWCRNGF